MCRISTDKDIAAAISDGAHTVEQIGSRCGAGTGCGSCRDFILDMLEESRAACPGGDCRECPMSASREAA